MEHVDKRAGQWEKRSSMYQMRPYDGSRTRPSTHLYTAYQPKTTLTWLYFRVVKLDPKLPSRLRERPVTFEHSLSV